MALQWNLPYLDLYYPGTSIVPTAQVGHVACSSLKFGLDESTRREPKVAVYLFGGLFILLIITTTWLVGDNGFLQPRGMTMNVL